MPRAFHEYLFGNLGNSFADNLMQSGDFYIMAEMPKFLASKIINMIDLWAEWTPDDPGPWMNSEERAKYLAETLLPALRDPSSVKVPEHIVEASEDGHVVEALSNEDEPTVARFLEKYFVRLQNASAGDFALFDSLFAQTWDKVFEPMDGEGLGQEWALACFFRGYVRGNLNRAGVA